ncbi:unnamed protein product [Lepeophtheirus salmonis]|uniref:(salmon louse) hypothetical protein n=1 Tax=Lepeophtheirus salmonis TaxID=72036 RepID=A0A7R8HBF1_LEPSM|nr:unnamed protein product [Lepeophtheirus salmonis]CAF2972257.1 unnamed protein product [Lepeophtheirus salmonis]
MEHFLRHGYANHRSITLKNATAHDISHALGHTSSVVTCEECQLPFQVAYFVKKFVNANLHTLVDNCAEKSKLYMAHLIRVENQNNDCMQHVQNYMEMGMNILSPLELYVALTTNGGVVDTVVTMFELNRASIELFMQQFSDAFRHFSRIKQCNEILFSDKSVMIYEYSGEFFHSIEHFDDKIESEDDEEHDSIEDIIVFDQTEDEDDIPLDENFDGFCGTLTLCKFMKSITRYPNQLKKSKPNTQNSTALLDELLEFVDKKDELLCDTCNRNFSTEAKMTQHICKRIRSSNDLVSAAIKHAELFVREGNVNLDNIKKAYDVSIEKTNIEEQGMMDFFQDHLVGFSPSFFNKGWAVKHGYDKAYGFKYITKYKGDIDIMIEKCHKNQKNKMGPGKMREALQKMYPEQLDIPSETEIRERINSRSARRRRDSNIRHFEKTNSEHF